MVTAEKLASFGFILLGLVFLFQSIGMMYVLVTISGLIEGISTIGAVTGTTVPSFTTYLIAGWVYAILLLITGVVCLLAGGGSLLEK